MPFLPKPSLNLPVFLWRLFYRVLPLARTELSKWTTFAGSIPDDTLRYQALQSLSTKRFHADGGCVYAAGNPASMETLVKLIVALQTISDYLDNLCDRCDTYDATDFEQLHLAMLDAVVPNGEFHDYYAFRNGADDGGYLDALVRTCRAAIAQLPAYQSVQDDVRWLVERYCELQVHKHIEPTARKERLVMWWQNYRHAYEDITWYEFAAATGSTLGVFALFLAASSNETTREFADEVQARYFPHICALHILLDYLIDLSEDELEGDFNFVACYDNVKSARRRLWHFARRARREAAQLHDNRLHRYVANGLAAMYLSDGKVSRQPKVKSARRIVVGLGPMTWVFYGACRLYRIVR